MPRPQYKIRATVELVIDSPTLTQATELVEQRLREMTRADYRPGDLYPESAVVVTSGEVISVNSTPLRG